MSTPDNERYFNFPLVLMRLTIDEPMQDVLDRIVDWCICDHVKRTRRDEGTALAQLVHDTLNQRQEHTLPASVLRITRKPVFTRLLRDGTEYLEPYSFAMFDELRDFVAEQNPSLTESDFAELVKWDSIRGAAAFFGFTVNRQECIESSARKLSGVVSHDADEHGPSALARVPKAYLSQVAGQKSLTEDDARLFRVVVGVRSLLGHKPYAGTTKDMLRARCVGAKTPAIAEQYADESPAVRAELDELSSRKRFDRLLTLAASRGFFAKYGAGRRVYVSTQIHDLDQLAATVAKRRDRPTEYRERERKAREKTRRRQPTQNGKPDGQQGDRLGAARGTP